MTTDPPERAGAWRSAGLWPFFILFGQNDQSRVDSADSLTDTLLCWVWVTDNKLLRVTTMRKVVCELKDGSAAYVRKGGLWGNAVGGYQFSGLTLTTSKSHATKFDKPDDVASAINGMLAMGFYPQLKISFAH